ncbi:hypothetical protein OS493_036228 [Desmophyllum pertusum]|uniref:Uncharacterized protein n=1 Tax=Desmophyllum pertusum TaxID=174260 RepID=A0A9W9Y7E9_9CNID|nr:hypothetical protein OS493_036228 [Desmophyllum pertusum]
MSEIVEYFEKKARFQDENEAELIREKLEGLVTNILTQVKKRDKRFQSTLVESGSVYEGVKVRQPDEFDFMIRINSLTNKPSLHSCDKGDGYVKLVLDEHEWEEFKDEEGFFNPNLLSRYFKELVMESLSDAEVPEGLVIQRASPDLFDKSWWPTYSGILGNSGGQENPSGVIYSETHGPATTLDICWQGGDSYRNLIVNVDLTLTLDYPISKLPVQLAKFPQQIDVILQKCGFHVVPAGFDSWRISFSMAEKEVLSSSPDGFKACYRVLKVVRDDISERLGWNASLVPSYMFKTVLLSQLFTTPGHTWQKDFCSQRVIHILDLVLQGVTQEKIQSFFIPGHSLLSVADHENKLRQCAVEDMLNQIKGLEMVLTPEDVMERKQQVKVLQLIDLLEYMISCILNGNNPTAVWNMMFVNIGNVPGGRSYSDSESRTNFWNQLTDLNSTKLNEDTYWYLIEIWSMMEDFFKQLLTTLQGELNLLAQKFKIFIGEKRTKFELEHTGQSQPQVQHVTIPQFASGWFIEDIVDNYMREVNSNFVKCTQSTSPWLQSVWVLSRCC